MLWFLQSDKIINKLITFLTGKKYYGTTIKVFRNQIYANFKKESFFHYRNENGNNTFLYLKQKHGLLVSSSWLEPEKIVLAKHVNKLHGKKCADGRRLWNSLCIYFMFSFSTKFKYLYLCMLSLFCVVCMSFQGSSKRRKTAQCSHSYSDNEERRGIMCVLLLDFRLDLRNELVFVN